MFIMAVAVAIGLGAMVFTRQMLSGASAEATREVLVAARDFKEEELIKPDMVKVIRMAKSAVPANAFASPRDVEERWIRTTMLEGDVIVEKKLGPKGTPPGLVANIPKGMRAFAIDVTEQSGVSGFILPGHRVDVVRHEVGDRNGPRAETILQNVLVLAAGQVFSRPEERSVQSRTVTLALKPAEVDIMVVARAQGVLSLALRGVNDHDVVSREPNKPATDPEHEQQLKLAEEKRVKLEEELRQLKMALARKVDPSGGQSQKPPRIATIYRGAQKSERIRTDLASTAELELPESAAFPDGTARDAQASASTIRVNAVSDQPRP
jgi:pilus assembly protein CpaB